MYDRESEVKEVKENFNNLEKECNGAMPAPLKVNIFQYFMIIDDSYFIIFFLNIPTFVNLLLKNNFFEFEVH